MRNIFKKINSSISTSNHGRRLFHWNRCVSWIWLFPMCMCYSLSVFFSFSLLCFLLLLLSKISKALEQVSLVVRRRMHFSAQKRKWCCVCMIVCYSTIIIHLTFDIVHRIQWVNFINRIAPFNKFPFSIHRLHIWRVFIYSFPKILASEPIKSNQNEYDVFCFVSNLVFFWLFFPFDSNKMC